MYNRRQIIAFSLLAIILFFAIFIAIPGEFSDINSRVVKPSQVSIKNTKYLATIGNSTIDQVSNRLNELAIEMPGYGGGEYTARDLQNLSNGFAFSLTPDGGSAPVKVYVEMSGFSDTVIYIDGKAKGPDYIPNLYQIQKQEEQKSIEPNSVSGYKIYPNTTNSDAGITSDISR